MHICFSEVYFLVKCQVAFLVNAFHLILWQPTLVHLTL